MRSGTWRRVLVGSASVAVTASLLVVPASVVSSSELAEAPAQEPVATVAEEPADSAIAPRRDNSQIFGETLVRLKVSMGEDDPVARGKVLVSSVEGKLLLRGYTNAMGQVVFLTQQKLPDRVVVRVKGGQSKGLKGDPIDLRAFFEPRDGEVVDVNPLTTMDELCRSGNYGTYCSTAVDSFYRLKGSVDYRDLVAISDRWFDGSRFGREAAKRGLTTWQWAERVLLKAYAGKKAPKVRANSERSDASPRSAAATAASWTFASVGSSLMRSAAGGIAGSLAARYFNKLMVAAGVFEGEPDIIGEIDSLRREMRAHFAEVQRGITDLKEGQARLQAGIDGLAAAASDARYQAAVRSFNANARGNRITSLVDSWQFLVEFAACMEQERPGCTSRAQQSVQSADDINACSSATAVEAPAGAGRQLVVLCAEFRRLLREYSRDFTIRGVRDVVLGTPSTGTQGLVPLAQDHYARYTLGGIVTGLSQPAMIDLGSYWMGEWAKDKAAWALIVADPILGGSIRGESADQAWRKAQELQAEYVSVNADTSGRYFPERIPASCTWAFYDVQSRAMYARGHAHFIDRRTNAESVNRVFANSPQAPVGARDGACPWLGQAGPLGPTLGDGWRPVNAPDVSALGNVFAELRRLFPATVHPTRRHNGAPVELSPTRLAIGGWGGQSGCYEIELSKHLLAASGSVIACPYLDYAKTTPAVEGMACASVGRNAIVPIYLNKTSMQGNRHLLVDAGWGNSPWFGCVQDPDSPRGFFGSHSSIDSALFPGISYKEWDECGRTVWKPWPVCEWRWRGPFKGAEYEGLWESARIGGGTIASHLPVYTKYAPDGSKGKLQTWVRYSLLTRPFAGVPDPARSR